MIKLQLNAFTGVSQLLIAEDDVTAGDGIVRQGEHVVVQTQWPEEFVNNHPFREV